MRNVDHHADSIHLAYNLLAKVSQAIVLRLAGGRICPIIAAEVGERHRKDSHPAIHSQYGEVVIDLVATFNGQHRRDFLLGDDTFDVCCTRGQLDEVGMSIEVPNGDNRPVRSSNSPA